MIIGYEMTDIEMQVCAKGLKIVPSVKRVDRHQKHLDFDRFAIMLRLGDYTFIEEVMIMNLNSMHGHPKVHQVI